MYSGNRSCCACRLKECCSLPKAARMGRAKLFTCTGGGILTVHLLKCMDALAACAWVAAGLTAGVATMACTGAWHMLFAAARVE